jgi:hypothetical protein
MSAKDDILPLLWETLQRLLFAVVMSLQGIITNIIHSRIGTLLFYSFFHAVLSGFSPSPLPCPCFPLPRCLVRASPFLATSADLHPYILAPKFVTVAPANSDGVPVTMEILSILRSLAFVSTRFGYSAFQEYNFVYLSSIDILSFSIPQSITFIKRHIPSLGQHPNHIPLEHTPDHGHPAIKADTLFFLDTLEYFVPILPREDLFSLTSMVQEYLSPEKGRDKKVLESAHSVYLAILARGDVSLSQERYIQIIYSVLPPVSSYLHFVSYASVLCLSSACPLSCPNVVLPPRPLRTTSPPRLQYPTQTLPLPSLKQPNPLSTNPDSRTDS